MTDLNEINVNSFQEAKFYIKDQNLNVKCQLCHHYCHIPPNNVGLCKTRLNIKGKLLSLNYGLVKASGLDPIEKKPLFHFKPGHKSFSIATEGCNFSCLHCQNYNLSQIKNINLRKTAQQLENNFLPPELIVKKAMASKAQSIAYTYSEPSIFYEYATDIATFAYKNNLANVFISNGYISLKALDNFQYLTAANIDLKAFSQSFYKKICKADLEPVLESIKFLHKKNIHLEITTLIIPSLNDSEKEIKALVEWLAEIDEQIPWHISKFYPSYKLNNLSPTPLETLENIKKLALQIGLKHVYIGNINKEQNTFCPNCKKLLIQRSNYNIITNNLKNTKNCIYCNHPIKGLW